MGLVKTEMDRVLARGRTPGAIGTGVAGRQVDRKTEGQTDTHRHKDRSTDGHTDTHANRLGDERLEDSK